MKVFSIEEFAAKRRAVQDAAIADLTPLAEHWIENIEDADALDALIEEATTLYLSTYQSEGGEGSPDGEVFADRLKDALSKTTASSDPKTVATLVAIYATNLATVAAAGDDAEPLVLEWVTMHDGAVRAAHREAEGQQRPPGEMFDVGGEEMPFPGWPGAEIENWINCRCTLAPVLAANAFNVMMSTTQGEGMEENESMEAVGPIEWHGVLAPEGVWSGDGRRFAENALRFRDLPLPLTWQKASSDGHMGSVVIGRIDSIERVDGMMQANGVFLANIEADEFVGLLAEFGKFGVSVDADDAEFEFDEDTSQVTFTSARIASASCVAIPAFSEAYVAFGPWPTEETADDLAATLTTASTITINGDPNASTSVTLGRGPGWITNPADTKRLHDYWTKPGEEGYAKIAWGVPGDFNRCRVLVGEKIATNSPEDMRFLNQICAQWHKDALGIWPGEHHAARDTIEGAEQGDALHLVAAGGHCAPSEWFENPEFEQPTHLTVTEDGRVFGHIAEWGTCHIGFEGVCVSPPRSETDYAYYATGSVLLDNGEFARTGVISLGGGHAGKRLRPQAAIEHYDSTSAAVCDVAVGDDEFGIWCAGWVRPGTTPEQIVALRASDVSGDWREIGGNLEMVAALSVNVQGFPVKVAAHVENGRQLALVAAGMVSGETVETNQIEALAEEIAVRLEARQTRREQMAALIQRVGGGN